MAVTLCDVKAVVCSRYLFMDFDFVYGDEE